MNFSLQEIDSLTKISLHENDYIGYGFHYEAYGYKNANQNFTVKCYKNKNEAILETNLL